jgi:linoleoyl-CoA desaturase
MSEARKIRFDNGNHTSFYRVLKQRVGEHLTARGADRYGDWRLWMKGAVYTAVALGSYLSIVTNLIAGWVALLAATAYCTAILLLAINLGHDAAHDTLSRQTWINRVVQSAIFALLGANSYLWRLRHVKSHHTFPNVNGCDIDIDENPFLRLSPNHPRRWWQRFQHFYAPITYWLVALHTIFYQDFVYLRKRRLANMVDIEHPWWAYALFIVGKTVYLTVTFVVPVMLMEMPWWQTLLGAFLASGVSSILFVSLLIGTHFTEQAAFPVVDENHRLPHSWAEHALLTAVDWNPASRVAAFVAGGVNAHAAHHLFPSLSHVHYRELSAIIRETAREFGIRYNETTLTKMLISHFRFLRSLARDDLSSIYLARNAQLA